MNPSLPFIILFPFIELFIIVSINTIDISKYIVLFVILKSTQLLWIRTIGFIRKTSNGLYNMVFININ